MMKITLPIVIKENKICFGDTDMSIDIDINEKNLKNVPQAFRSLIIKSFRDDTVYDLKFDDATKVELNNIYNNLSSLIEELIIFYNENMSKINIIDDKSNSSVTE